MSSKAPSGASSHTSLTDKELEWSVTPEFIYGGPFIKPLKVEPFMDSVTPRNTVLQGTYKQSFAFFSLKERLPIILTKIIDYCSREGSKIKSTHNASDGDLRSFIEYVSKLKNELVTNKNYELLQVDTENAKKWNTWIGGQPQQTYFTNMWLFSECYVYRRLREGCELTKGLKSFDPFDAQKDKSFADSVELMCVVAEALATMLADGGADKRKADFQTLLKLCLWSNKCDLSLSAGEQVNLAGQKGDVAAATFIDPFQMILDSKDKLLTDDTGKIADNVINKAAALANKIAGAPPPGSPPPGSQKGSPTSSQKGSPPPTPAPAEGEEAKPEEKPKIPCPAKMVLPQHVIFDIICDNAGYELFTDLCLAHFLVAQKIVDKVRFHVKDMPWFVSDVTVRDFKYVIDACSKSNYSRTVPGSSLPVPGETKPGADAQAEPAARAVSAARLRAAAAAWGHYVQDGTFLVVAEEYWTCPHVYRDMKTLDYNLYRKLQYAVAILFKGDLNYRKLLGEVNCNPYLGFANALQGFNPAPVIAVRTVKADLICGMPKGRYEVLMKQDPKWMEKGDYGVIQFCPKAEALKPATVPCIDYGQTCFSAICPVHDDM